jgi:hypothetical protein
VTLKTRNATGATIEGSTLVTAKGVYWISAIPAGDSVVTGSRTASTAAEFVEKEGQRAVQRDRFTPTPSDENGNGNGIGISEKALNPIVRKSLIGAFLPQTPQDTTAEVTTGFARSLQIQRWLDSGGSVLLTWPDAREAVVRYNPKPGRLTAVILERYFQGPPP